MTLTDADRIKIAVFINGGTLANGWSIEGDEVVIDCGGWEERMTVAQAVAEGEKYNPLDLKEEYVASAVRYPTSITA